MQCFQGTTKSQYEQDVWDQARSDLSADLSAIMQLTVRRESEVQEKHLG